HLVSVCDSCCFRTSIIIPLQPPQSLQKKNNTRENQPNDILRTCVQCDNSEESLLSHCTLMLDCREETYPCTRMYSVHRPVKRCIHSLCFYSLPRVYVINKEICVRTVCQQEEFLMAELCREKSGWPKRLSRSTKKRCLRQNPKTWSGRA
uniref:Microfibril associated protein 5 n=1 Tax=Denticeps clupeoides TaxID=299321 RepID=A0AAY4AIW2_9TELE